MKITTEQDSEPMPIPKVIRPKIGGKNCYARIPIARRHSIAARYENRLYIGSVVAGEIVGMYECHPDAIPEKIIPNGKVRELAFGEIYQIGVFEAVEYLNDVEENGGEE